uniref:ATP-binding of ABC transporter domain protein n=1 Tax=Rhizobium rhizogenes TaxID=359 RepID=A0A7S5DQ58_RHIRH|nr:ATP-binding of ABC transporter domain protein [Rhizobium rhizogenes]
MVASAWLWGISFPIIVAFVVCSIGFSHLDAAACARFAASREPGTRLERLLGRGPMAV